MGEEKNSYISVKAIIINFFLIYIHFRILTGHEFMWAAVFMYLDIVKVR
jgi:hypothetical protein